MIVGWSAGLLLGLTVASARAGMVSVPRQVDEAWTSYVQRFIQEDGRVMDPKAGGITTSEGQAYALARAAWIGDRPTFERVRTWTRDNLQGGDDGALPAWKWGRAGDGSWEVLDRQPASDADQWMAWALLLAHARWAEVGHRQQASRLLERIWTEEVARSGERYVLLPGPWARDHAPWKLNPSYFLFFAWRDFAVADPAHPWHALLDDGYALLDEATPPGTLPGDWIHVDGGLPVATGAPEASVFGYEAFRLPWTLAAEVRWNEAIRADALLERILAVLETHRARGFMPARLDRLTTVGIDGYEYPGMLGALLPAWAIRNASTGRAFYRAEIAPRRDGAAWGDPEDYYTQNWAWFGLALWRGLPRPPRVMP